jgi:Cu+-exporting ATPase
MSIMVGVGRGAQAGVLIRDAEALETMEKVRTLIVDKTGTLTEGKPILAKVAVAEGWTENDLLHLIASLEAASEHPLASAILRGAKERGLSLDAVNDFASVTGGGVSGVIRHRQVAIGNLSFQQARGITGWESFETTALSLRKTGHTVMFVSVDAQPAGIIAVVDPIKPTTRQAID